MRCIGLIGGISWGATAEYYRLINLGVKDRLGGHHSAEMLIRSLDLHPLLEQAQDVARLEQLFAQVGESLQRGGAGLLAIASFTGHRYAAGLRRLELPVVDLLDALAQDIRRAGATRVAVWATSYALGDAELLDRLQRRAMAQLVPVPEQDRAKLDRIIFDELADRRLSEVSASWLRALLARQGDAGAEALLLATTDLSPVRASLQTNMAVLDASEIHCAALVDAALAR